MSQLAAEAPGPFNFKVLARVLHVFAGAPIDDSESSAHARIDLRAHILPGRRGEQPSTRLDRIEPGVKDPFGRSAEAMGSARARYEPSD